jgi:hypothetical protein
MENKLPVYIKTERKLDELKSYIAQIKVLLAKIEEFSGNIFIDYSLEETHEAS